MAKTPKSPAGLTREQVIDVLIEAKDPKEAAGRLGLSVPEFLSFAKQAVVQRDLRGVNRALGEVASAKVGANGSRAVALLVDLMEREGVQDSVRFAAARELLERHEKWVEREDVIRRVEAAEREIRRLRLEMADTDETGEGDD